MNVGHKPLLDHAKQRMSKKQFCHHDSDGIGTGALPSEEVIPFVRYKQEIASPGSKVGIAMTISFLCSTTQKEI
jgi:hypothetical protein